MLSGAEKWETSGCIHNGDFEYTLNICYPLENIQQAIENGHRNSGFTH